jgi:hypothetical protein
MSFPDRQAADVGAAVLKVFEQAGFELKRADKQDLEFLRRSGQMDQAIYGGLVSGGVWERVRIRIMPVSETEQRVELRAEKVRSPGDQVFEEAHRISNPKHYAEQVAAIRARLE